MKVKTADLIGPALDWAVGTALEMPVEICQIFQYGRPNGEHYISVGETDKDGAEVTFEPSEEWSQGGPLIESEKIALLPPNNHRGDSWKAFYYEPSQHDLQFDEAISYSHHGPTPLIAAMRCFIASKLGDEIEIPEELL